eukprot:symbB.v1.2.029450.t1/scaffold3186.1/size61749/3
MGVLEGRRSGLQPCLVVCVMGSMLWLVQNVSSGQQAVGEDAFVSIGARGRDQSLRRRALPLAAPMSQAVQAPSVARGSGLPPQIRNRIASLKREAIMACLKAVNDDTEAVELCARLSRKLSYIKTIIRRQMENAGVTLGSDW